MTLIAVEATLRQASASLSIATAAYFQASLSIIGAVSAGIAQYTGGRLLPVASAARSSGDQRPAWAETRRSLLVVTIFMTAITGTLVVLAPIVLTVGFSSRFVEAVPLLRMILVGETLVAISTVVSTTLVGLGHTSAWATMAILPAIARVTTYFLLAGSASGTRLGGSYAVGGALAAALTAGAYRRFKGRAS
jgi:O-antigen/teichoic acid export membrane protein